MNLVLVVRFSAFFGGDFAAVHSHIKQAVSLYRGEIQLFVLSYYAVRFCVGVKRFSSVSAAASSADLIACAYILLVVTVSA